jgi:hypothetical protein
MSKLGLHDPFGYPKHKLWAKERSGVKLSIWLPTTKSWKSLRFLCRWCATYHWKDLDKGYNFALDFISIGGLHTKLFAFKVVRVPILGISRLSLGNLGTKWHLGAGVMPKHRVYYKWEGGGFPQVQAVVSLVNLCLPVARPCTKSDSVMH